MDGFFSVHLIYTVSSGGSFSPADIGPQPILTSDILLSAFLISIIRSWLTCTMIPSSTMEDFADNPDELFRAPFKTKKLAPVTRKQCLLRWVELNCIFCFIYWIMIRDIDHDRKQYTFAWFISNINGLSFIITIIQGVSRWRILVSLNSNKMGICTGAKITSQCQNWVIAVL